MNIRHFLPVAMLLAFSANASAENPGCVELSTTASTEQPYVDANGQKATRLVPAAKIVPGDEVVWTITARNICKLPVDRIVIANAVPEHMTFVTGGDTSIGVATTYSLDGKDFHPASELTVKASDGSTRSAPPSAYRAVRWTYGVPLASGAETQVRYRAAVN
jgi:uncharacterized repeat protein (TIGR01451 family)